MIISVEEAKNLVDFKDWRMNLTLWRMEFRLYIPRNCQCSKSMNYEISHPY